MGDLENEKGVALMAGQLRVRTDEPVPVRLTSHTIEYNARVCPRAIRSTR